MSLPSFYITQQGDLAQGKLWKAQAVALSLAWRIPLVSTSKGVNFMAQQPPVQVNNRNNNAPAIIIGLVIAALIVVGIIFFLNRNGTSTTTAPGSTTTAPGSTTTMPTVPAATATP
jgi:hypothetical protein